MPKGEKNQGSQNKPKLTVKEKAGRKAAKRAKHLQDPPLLVVPKR